MISSAAERMIDMIHEIFQVATNPGRPIIYGGCSLVVLGALVFELLFARRREELGQSKRS